MLRRSPLELPSVDKHVGRAHSPADSERVRLRGGSTIVIRPLVTGDEAAIGSWFAGLGAETRYARFLRTARPAR
jgi:hypothetical protein